jgi:rubredoxin
MMKKILVISTSLLLALTGCAQTGDPDHTHDLTFVKGVSATCTEDGYEAYFKCNTCNKLYSDDLAENEISSPAVLPATGHGSNLHYFPAVEGSCIDVGVDAYYECYQCDNLYSDSEGTQKIEAPQETGYGAHKLKYVAEVPGGCVSYTVLEHYECELCHKLFTDDAGKVETTIEDLQTGSLSSHSLSLVQGSPKTNFVDGTKTHYECSACHLFFTDETGSTNISADDIKEVSDGWVRFGFSTATNTNNVQSTAITMKDKIFDETKDIKGTKVVFKAAMNSEAHFIHDTNGHDKTSSGVNARVRLVAGKQLTYKLYVKNTGVGDLKFRVCYNDNNNESGPIVDVKQGQEVTLSETINHTHGSGTRGGWIKIIAKGNISAGASYETYGYYKSKDYLPFDDVNNCFEIERAATKVKFNVGEKFSSEGLLLRMFEAECTSNTDTGYVTSYETNYDGHTFTESDIGTKTV